MDAALNALVKLYKNKENAVNLLGQVRLNPDLTSKKGKESSYLEFFIPQLCSFYLQNNSPSDVHFKLIDFIGEACQRSPFFAHKVYFFFKSNLEQYPTKAKLMLERLEELM